MKSHSRNLQRTAGGEGYGKDWSIACFLGPMGNPSGTWECPIRFEDTL